MSTLCIPMARSEKTRSFPVTGFGISAAHHIANSWVCLGAVCFAVWLLVRYAFFVGYEGSDDMFYVRFAALWNHTPINHWEARLVGNALLRASFLAFGVSEWAAVLPAALASLTTLVMTLLACKWLGSIKQAWWAGLFVALVSVDVRNATGVSSHSIMVAFMSVGTLAFLLASDSRWALAVAALFLPLGVVTHYNGSYYVASLLLAAFLIAPRRYARTVLAVAITAVAAMFAEMMLFRFAYGDMLLGLRLNSPDTLTKLGDLPASRLTWSMIVWSLQQFVLGAPFGIALLVTSAGIAVHYRRLATPFRILAVAAITFWLVLSFGSLVPWDYRPFWRNARYLHTLVLPVTLLFAALMVQANWRTVKLVGAASLATCVLMLTLVGSWGQNTGISRELLYYALSHQGQQFVTDVHTANEMYILNGLTTPSNVAGTMDYGRSHYLDKKIRLVHQIAPTTCDAILINPINVERTPSFAALVEPCMGLMEYESKPENRMLCRWAPFLRDDPWAIRKPPARAYGLSATCGALASSDLIIPDHATALDLQDQ